ncbi:MULTISPECIES: serine/threonine protein kinase [Priestia]|uniref:non-specific serine/threonine protein kinase n=3 Tax=Priestia TaxID=2800373 RepID=A0AAX6BP97_PRIMG|nr:MULTISPECIES: serine/threonine-protein kinase [Priestia]MBK0293845.1 serine/threonine protein kinase [Bacillus sp. S34]MCL9636236.1 serine/threonine protein kinase [Bacillus zanthoxyli]UPK51214.1 serine/threonine protein kinase [Bacillus sp. H8-1]AWD63843.1 serine/threonine protein kinase [Priestia megaterium]MBY0004446.1 serine/threonine protein kinase [Priestia aryabhattai]
MKNRMFKHFHRWLVDRPFKKGTVICERYEIINVLGMGSYGITYVASDIVQQKEVVIKQLRKTKQRTPQGLKSFHYEAKLLSQLDHPQIPSLYEAVEIDEGCFLVMELIQGKTFEDLIFEEKRVYTEEKALDILLDILKVVSVIHEQGIVHRDLRIPNIIDVNGTIYVIDFGLARFLGAHEETSSLIEEQQFMRQTSVASDIYALGHFLLFLLYSGYEPTDKQEKSWEQELSLSAPIKTIIQKMLRADEAYESIKSLQKDIYDYINSKNSGREKHGAI